MGRAALEALRKRPIEALMTLGLVSFVIGLSIGLREIFQNHYHSPLMLRLLALTLWREINLITAFGLLVGMAGVAALRLPKVSARAAVLIIANVALLTWLFSGTLLSWLEGRLAAVSVLAFLLVAAGLMVLWRRRSRRLALGSGLLVLAGVLLPDAMHLWDRLTPPAGRTNVVWIALDALRADHLGAYGYPRETTPFLDALSARGVRFANAISQESYTLASVSSYLTSTYPWQHRTLYSNLSAGGGVADALPIELFTIAEALRNEGYLTAGIVTNPFLNKGSGFAQGFDIFDNICVGDTPSKPCQKPTAASVHHALEAAVPDLKSRPFFLYLHYLDPHDPYQPAPGYCEKFTGGVPCPKIDYRYSAAEAGAARDRYDGEIRYLDDYLARAFELFRSNGITEENTLFVLSSDHGEEFYDPHPDDVGGRYHERTLYQELLHVPLIFVSAGQAKGHVAEEYVELNDVIPTILDCLGLHTPVRRQFQGASLAAVLAGRRLFGRAVFAGGNHERGTIVEDGWKYIESSAFFKGRQEIDLIQDQAPPPAGTGAVAELYNLSADPAESRNLLAAEPERSGALAAQLHSEIGLGQRYQPGTHELDNETLRQLKTLGYF